MKSSSLLMAIYYSISICGGTASLHQIYNLIKKNTYLDLDGFSDWKSLVRKQIYIHSSDTDIFNGKKYGDKDLFYAVYEKGDGVWGIRSK